MAKGWSDVLAAAMSRIMIEVMRGDRQAELRARRQYNLLLFYGGAADLVPEHERGQA